jgi:hypothetical protein
MTVAVKCGRVDAAVEVFASWVRVLEKAPIENRPKLLAMMARDARDWAESQRQHNGLGGVRDPPSDGANDLR